MLGLQGCTTTPGITCGRAGKPSLWPFREAFYRATHQLRKQSSSQRPKKHLKCEDHSHLGGSFTEEVESFSGEGQRCQRAGGSQDTGLQAWKPSIHPAPCLHVALYALPALLLRTDNSSTGTSRLVSSTPRFERRKLLSPPLGPPSSRLLPFSSAEKAARFKVACRLS